MKFGGSRNVVYPEDKEGKTKDANRKLKAQVRDLTKKNKRLRSENKTLVRAFDKSCDFMQEKMRDFSLDQILQMIRDFEYKETEKGRDREQKKEVEEEEEEGGGEILTLEKCPDCDKVKGEGYVVLSYSDFKVKSCQCGFRSKVGIDEGIERS